jgi:excisionase family DNA binding protein
VNGVVVRAKEHEGPHLEVPPSIAGRTAPGKRPTLRRVVGRKGTDEDWITVQTAAKLLGLRPETVRHMIENGELGGVETYGVRMNGGPKRRRSFRLTRQDVDAFLERARVRPGDLRGPIPPRHWSPLALTPCCVKQRSQRLNKLYRSVQQSTTHETRYLCATGATVPDSVETCSKRHPHVPAPVRARLANCRPRLPRKCDALPLGRRAGSA